MAVPDTNTFSLGDVVSELGLGAGSSLGDCFSAANSSSFDPAYEGSKDRLSNFRNYGAGPPTSVTLTWGGTTSPTNACAMINPETYWIPFGSSFNSATKLYDDSDGLVLSATGYYSNGSSYRYWDKSAESFTETGLCM